MQFCDAHHETVFFSRLKAYMPSAASRLGQSRNQLKLRWSASCSGQQNGGKDGRTGTHHLAYCRCHRRLAYRYAWAAPKTRGRLIAFASGSRGRKETQKQDEARRIPANVAKLPELLRRKPYEAAPPNARFLPNRTCESLSGEPVEQQWKTFGKSQK